MKIIKAHLSIIAIVVVDVLAAGLYANAGVNFDLCDFARGRSAVFEDGFWFYDGLVEDLLLLRDTEAVPEGLIGLPCVADLFDDPLRQRTEGVEIFLGVVDYRRTHPESRTILPNYKRSRFELI
jgi:hypothetical protein